MDYSAYQKQVGRNIAAARTRAGLKQIEIEQQIGMEYKHYQKIEAGAINVSLETLFRLAGLFGCDVCDLVRPK